MKNLIKGVLLVILALPQVSFDCLSQDKETVSMNLDRLKERLGVRFVYDSELGKLLDKNYEGTSVEGLTLEKALGRLLEGTGIKWEVRNGYVVLTRDTPVRKRYTVCGYVTDEVTGETLIGAGVTVSELAEMTGVTVASTGSATEEIHSVTAKTGTSTNNFGFYSLTIPEGEVELTYSYIGCAARTKRINLKKNLNAQCGSGFVCRDQERADNRPQGCRNPLHVYGGD